MELNQSQLKELLHYNPETGEFTWVAPPGYKIRPGSKAGCLRPNGYMQIGINRKVYRSHRLAFLYIEGEMPPNHVDHINRNPLDNRWSNLRHATSRLNMSNRKDNNSFIGVRKNNNAATWVTRAPAINGVQEYLGSFKTHLAACYARHSYDQLNKSPVLGNDAGERA